MDIQVIQRAWCSRLPEGVSQGPGRRGPSGADQGRRNRVQPEGGAAERRAGNDTGTVSGRSGSDVRNDR